MRRLCVGKSSEKRRRRKEKKKKKKERDTVPGWRIFMVVLSQIT